MRNLLYHLLYSYFLLLGLMSGTIFPMTRLNVPRYSRKTITLPSSKPILWQKVRSYEQAMKEKGKEKIEKIKLLFDQIKKLTTRQLEKFSYELGKQEEKSAIPLEKRIGAVYEILLEGLEAEDIEEVQELVKRRLFESYAKGNFSAIKAFFGYQPDTSEQAYMKWVRDIYCKGNDDCYKKWLIVYKKQKAKTEKEVKDRKERESKE